MASLAPETYQMLDRLSEDMERTLQAVRKSESKLNSQCKDQVEEYAGKQEKLQRQASTVRAFMAANGSAFVVSTQCFKPVAVSVPEFRFQYTAYRP